MKGGNQITAQLEVLNQRSQNDRRDAFKLFSEQSPLDRTKAEIRKHLEAAVVYRISVLTNVSTFGKRNPAFKSPNTFPLFHLLSFAPHT